MKVVPVPSDLCKMELKDAFLLGRCLFVLGVTVEGGRSFLSLTRRRWTCQTGTTNTTGSGSTTNTATVTRHWFWACGCRRSATSRAGCCRSYGATGGATFFSSKYNAPTADFLTGCALCQTCCSQRLTTTCWAWCGGRFSGCCFGTFRYMAGYGSEVPTVASFRKTSS